jgi:hypothetical protein
VPAYAPVLPGKLAYAEWYWHALTNGLFDADHWAEVFRRSGAKYVPNILRVASAALVEGHGREVQDVPKEAASHLRVSRRPQCEGGARREHCPRQEAAFFYVRG